METLSIFFEYDGEGTFYEEVSPTILKKYNAILPKYLLDLWEKRGLLHFKERFYWLVNPDEYYTSFYALFNSEDTHTFVLMRTGFGGLFILQKDCSPAKKKTNVEGKYYYYCPIFNQTTYLADSFKDVLNGWLTTKEIYESLTLWPIYKQATERLPKIEPNECYGFVPAIALGGDLDVENIKIIPIKEHLAFLAQLVGNKFQKT